MQKASQYAPAPNGARASVRGAIMYSKKLFYRAKNPVTLGKPGSWQAPYSPIMRSMAPTRIPNMEVEAESIPRRIYPTIAPTFRGMYVRLRFSLRMARKDFASAEIAGLFCFIRAMETSLSSCQSDITIFCDTTVL
jgi:hypothetical protein